LGLLSDPNGQDEAGESYVVFGSSGGFSANLNLSTSTAAMVINGIDRGDFQAVQSVQQAMSMAMALMTSLLGFPLPTQTVLARAMLCLARQKDSVPTSPKQRQQWL